MLRAYGPGCESSDIDASAGLLPKGATWFDLLHPTKEEEALVEKVLGLGVPTQEEMTEIEPSSRLFGRDNALYMTMSTLTGVEAGQPVVTPISFLLCGEYLVTVRYATPKPFRLLIEEIGNEPEITATSMTVLLRLLDGIVERLADELEDVGTRMDELSTDIFCDEDDSRRIPARHLTRLLSRIGRTQSLLVRIRETAVSAARLITFLEGSERLAEKKNAHIRDHVGSIGRDIKSLIDHSAFLSDNMTFILDASLGLISIEQNGAMKLFSWVAVVFLPPTLIAGIYGMNFDHMPELHWMLGYPMSLVLMVASAVLPLAYLKARRWI
jgi:magnesium transporter